MLLVPENPKALDVKPLAILFFALNAPQIAFGWTVDLLEPDKKPEWLHWQAKAFEVKMDPEAKGKASVTIQGTYLLKGAVLLTSKTTLVEMSNGKDPFSLKIPIEKETTQVTFMSVDPQGDVKTENYILKFQDWTKFRKSVPDLEVAPTPKRYSISASLGLSMISYDQVGETSFNEKAITLKGGGVYQLVPGKWDIGLSAYFTALPLTTNQINGIQARFLGVNARAGYTLSAIKRPWKVSLLGGFYYLTMFVPDDRFGVQHLQGPQVFPTVSRLLGTKGSLLGYLKLSPISNTFSILNLSSHEIAFGTNYTHAIKPGHSVSAGLDISFVSLEFNAVDQIYLNTVSLSAGYGF